MGNVVVRDPKGRERLSPSKAMKDLEDEEIVLRVEKDPLIGKKLGGRYELVSVLGRGGMGSVYKAHQIDIDRMVAIKTLHTSRIADSQVIQRFRSEAQAVSRVRHPNTVMLYDFGVSEEGVPYLVMDILDGQSFRQVIKDNAPLPLGRANYIFQQACAALAFAHESGIVHKDLKPENIMLCNRPGQPDWVYVLDFGIASMMESTNQQSHEIIGSPPYMSPEQCSMNKAVDHRSDIYSLGICLFETLTGKFPFQARTAMEMLECHLSGKPKVIKEMGTKFSTYESLSQLVLKAMEKQPEKRQQSISEFASELEDAIKKDSKRGMQLRDRATLEVDTPRVNDFVEIKRDEEAIANQKAQKASFADSIKSLIHGEADSKEQHEETEEDSKYYFSNCPHCNAPTQAGIALCLACGRSLASKDDFSRIRAAKGEFSLPKYQEMGSAPATAPSSRSFSQRTRNAMLKDTKIWTRTNGLILLCILLILAVFVLCGGSNFISNIQGLNNAASPELQPEKNSP